jgi:hypothetical protein
MQANTNWELGKQKKRQIPIGIQPKIFFDGL